MRPIRFRHRARRSSTFALLSGCGMKRSEMIEKVQRLLTADGSEDELEALLLELIAAAPDAEISDLIYYPSYDLSAEEIVDEALFRDRFLAPM